MQFFFFPSIFSFLRRGAPLLHTSPFQFDVVRNKDTKKDSTKTYKIVPIMVHS